MCKIRRFSILPWASLTSVERCYILEPPLIFAWEEIRKSVIYLDWRLFGAAGWRLFALAVDPPILQPAWRGFEVVERLERRIYTQFKEEAKEEGAVSC
jgi:hypothetical protein